MKKTIIVFETILFILLSVIFESNEAEAVKTATTYRSNDLPTIVIGKKNESQSAETKEKTIVEDKQQHFSPIIIWVIIGVSGVLLVVITLILVLKKKRRKNGADIRKSPFYKQTKQSFIVLKDSVDKGIYYRTRIVNKVSIGRGPDNTIKMQDDKSISTNHCEIIKRGNLYYINDCNSRNGTFYDGVRVCSETPIMTGGRISIGRRVFLLSIEE